MHKKNPYNWDIKSSVIKLKGFIIYFPHTCDKRLFIDSIGTIWICLKQVETRIPSSTQKPHNLTLSTQIEGKIDILKR